MKKILILVFSLFIGFTNVYSQAVVNDPLVNGSVLSEAVAVFTELMEMYDQTMNQIQMIQQKYEQMQFYIDRAANWKWDEVKWDGDLDFRNELTQATKNINRQLTNIRQIKNSLTTNTVSWGGQSYSLASLAGVPIEGQGNLEDFIKEGEDYYEDGFRKAAKYFEEGVPEREAQYIWSKYGLSPANYKMVRDVEKKVIDKASYLIGNAEEGSAELNKIEQQRLQILDEIMKMLENTDNLTEGEIAQAQAWLQQQTILELNEFKKTFNQAVGYIAWRNRLQDQKEESEAQSKMEKMKE